MSLSESLETKASVEIDNIINRVFQSVISQYSAKLVEITLRGVRELLFAIKSSKAMGPDRIGLNELTININITADILSSLFNYSTKGEENGLLVTPIHKHGSETAPNYRPISFICACCKLLELAIAHNLHDQVNDTLRTNKHGFRQRLLCTTQSANVSHNILKHNLSQSL